MTKKIFFRDLLLLSSGSMILAFGLCNIHSLADITEGGALGLTLLFEYCFGVSPAFSALILNGIFYLFGYKSLGKKFILYSAVCAVSFSAFYRIFEMLGPCLGELPENPLSAAIAGALFVGVGVGLCVRAGGAPTGDDALAMALSKVLKVKIQYVYLFSDLSVLLLSLIYIDFRKIVYSLLTVILSGQIIGLICKAPFRNYVSE